MKTVESYVDEFKNKYIGLWNHTDVEINSILTRYTRQEQKLKEKKLNGSINNLTLAVNCMPNDETETRQWENEIKELLKKEATILLEISNPKFQDFILDNFMNVADCFYQETKQFDELLKIVDVMQAMRNVWIMNLIQVIANQPIEFTPSIFAYSMLYPYTDNYLDDKAIKKEEKATFNQRLEKRLKGGIVQPTNDHEDKVFRLVAMIEKQYDRKQYPHVYESLLCIHVGQCKSLKQQKQQNQNLDEPIINISAEKGGTSVLADGYLVCGSMDEQLSEFSFGFGYILQLIDDLQDVIEDGESNSTTMFVKTEKGAEFDAITQKLIAFTYTALDFDLCKLEYKTELKQLILDNCLLLIMEAIAKNKALYTKQFLRKIERYSPIKLKMFNKAKKKIRKKIRQVDWDKF